MDRGAWQAPPSPWGRKELDTTEWLSYTLLEREEYQITSNINRNESRLTIKQTWGFVKWDYEKN